MYIPLTPPISYIPFTTLLCITFIAAKTVQPQSRAFIIRREVRKLFDGIAADITQLKSISTAQVISEVMAGSLFLPKLPSLSAGSIQRRPAMTRIAQSCIAPCEKLPITA